MTARIQIQPHPAPAATPVPPMVVGTPATPMQMPNSRPASVAYPATPSRVLNLPLPARTSGPSSDIDVLPSPLPSPVGSIASKTLISRMLSLPAQPSPGSPESVPRDARDLAAEIRRQVALELQLAGWEEVGTNLEVGSSTGGSLLAKSLAGSSTIRPSSSLEVTPSGSMTLKRAPPRDASRLQAGVEASPSAVPRVVAPTFSWGSSDSIRCEELAPLSPTSAVSPSSTASTRINPTGSASIRAGVSGSANARSVSATGSVGGFSGTVSQAPSAFLSLGGQREGGSGFLSFGGSMRSIPGGPAPATPLEPRSALTAISAGEPAWSPSAPQRMVSSPTQSFRVGMTPKSGFRQGEPMWSPAAPQRMVSSPTQSFRAAGMTPKAGCRQEPAFSPHAPSRTLTFGPTASLGTRQVAPPIRAAPLVVSPRNSPLNSTRNSNPVAAYMMGLRASNSDPMAWSSLGPEQPSSLPSASAMMTADEEAAANENNRGRSGQNGQSERMPSSPARSSSASPNRGQIPRSARGSRRHVEVGIRSSLKAHVHKQFAWDNFEDLPQLSRGSARSEQGMTDTLTENGSVVNTPHGRGSWLRNEPYGTTAGFYAPLAYPVGTSSVSTATGRFTNSTRTQSSLEDEGVRISELEAHKILMASVCSDKKAEDARRPASPYEDPSPSIRGPAFGMLVEQDGNRALADLRRAVPELRHGSVSEVERVFIQTLRQEHKGPKGCRASSRRGTIERSRSGGGSSAGSPRNANAPRNTSGSRSRAIRQPPPAGQVSQVVMRGRAESRDSFSPTGSVCSSKSRPTSFRSRTQNSVSEVPQCLVRS